MKPSIYIANVIYRASIKMHVSYEEILHGTFKAGHPSIVARRLIMLHLSRQGLTDEVIGRAMGRAPSTIRKHVQFAARKLEQSNRGVLDDLPVMP